MITLEQFDELLKKMPYSDKVVRLCYKYDFEKTFTVSNELLLFDVNSPTYYCWETDWYEGQQTVFVIGSIDIDNIVIEENTFK